MSLSINRILLTFGLFLLLVTIFISIRDQGAQAVVDKNKLSLLEIASISSVLEKPVIPHGLRIGSYALESGFSKLIVTIVSAFNVYDPKSFGGEGQMYFDATLAAFLSTLFLKFLFLTPIFFASLLLFKNLSEQTIFLVLIFLVLCGWGPWLYVSWYNFITTYVDWPRSWWLFRKGGFYLYDFFSMGYMFFLILYFSLRQRIRYLELASLCILSQLMFENLGLVTGLSVFFVTLLRSDSKTIWTDLRLASIRLIVCGVTSIVTLVLTLFLMIKEVEIFRGDFY